jgi:hypothetical protein
VVKVNGISNMVGNIEDAPTDPDNFPDAVTNIVSGIAELTPEDLHFTLFPNPSSGSTVCTFQLTAGAYVNMSLMDYTGREVLRLAEGGMDAGIHEFEVNADYLSKGIYFISLQVNEARLISKLVRY